MSRPIDATEPAVADPRARRPARPRLVALQEPSGAFVASPDFGEYQYCWLRDSSFIAYALDRAGMHGAAARYHAWVARALGDQTGIGPLIDEVVRRHRAGKPLDPTEMPPARFTLAGSVSADDWPNFQIDGYGAWLWGLEAHLEATGSDVGPFVAVVERLGRYLHELAFEPCYDVWEENVAAVHTSTLGASTRGSQRPGASSATRPRGPGRRGG